MQGAWIQFLARKLDPTCSNQKNNPIYCKKNQGSQVPQLRKSYDQPRWHIKKQKHYFANKCPSSQRSGFSGRHGWMSELDYKESWAPKNWYFWAVVLEKTLESPLDSKKFYSSLSSTYLFQLLTRLKEFSSICNLLMLINHEWLISLNFFSLLGWS